MYYDPQDPIQNSVRALDQRLGEGEHALMEFHRLFDQHVHNIGMRHLRDTTAYIFSRACMSTKNLWEPFNGIADTDGPYRGTANRLRILLLA